SDKRLTVDDHDARGLDKLSVMRSEVPAITHVDFSARVQTVDNERGSPFRPLLERFYALTGSPVAINTSFNIRGEPIVCTPEDAYRCFLATNMDVLVLESFLLLKEEQPELLTKREMQKYVDSFELD
ncbi:MAG: hypothetical protein OES47_08560, partial [Acidobacteriota bacterium]|nr:hypothetical protein [Acidobacteriota bacterium]